MKTITREGLKTLASLGFGTQAVVLLEGDHYIPVVVVAPREEGVEPDVFKIENSAGKIITFTTLGSPVGLLWEMGFKNITIDGEFKDRPMNRSDSANSAGKTAPKTKTSK